VVRLTVSTRARWGFSLFIAAVIAIAGIVSCGMSNFLDSNAGYIRIGLCLGGLLMCALGGRPKAAKDGVVAEAKGAGIHTADAEHPLAFLKRLRTWGTILTLAAILHMIISIYGHRPTGPTKRPDLAVDKPISPQRPGSTISMQVPEVTFPPLRLEGILVNGSNSSAIINGEVLWIGENLGNVRLVAVEAERVTVELQGQRKEVFFGK
jgi:hypothetical protein